MNTKTYAMVTAATILLERGDPIPLTLYAKLLEAGIDISAIESNSAYPSLINGIDGEDT